MVFFNIFLGGDGREDGVGLKVVEGGGAGRGGVGRTRHHGVVLPRRKKNPPYGSFLAE